MGRSVSHPTDALVVAFLDYETGYDVTEEHVAEGIHEADEIGDWIDDEFAFDDMRDWFETEATRRWPSLSLDDKWIGREDHALLSNSLVRMGMSEYCGLIAFWVVTHEGIDHEALAEAWARKIEPRFLRKMGTMSNGEGVYAPRRRLIASTCPAPLRGALLDYHLTT